jgi:hypothetical protein
MPSATPPRAAARISAGRTFARKADAEAWAADRRRQLDRGAADPAEAARHDVPQAAGYPERLVV